MFLCSVQEALNSSESLPVTQLNREVTEQDELPEVIIDKTFVKNAKTGYHYWI